MSNKWYDILISWIKKTWKELNCNHSGMFGEMPNGEIVVQCMKCGKIQSLEDK